MTSDLRTIVLSLLALQAGLYVARVQLGLVHGVATHFITFDAFRHLLFIGGGRSMNGVYAAGTYANMPLSILSLALS